MSLLQLLADPQFEFTVCMALLVIGMSRIFWRWYYYQPPFNKRPTGKANTGISNLYSRLCQGEVIHAINPENGLQFDIEQGTFEDNTPACVVRKNGAIVDKYVLDQGVCDDWSTRISERTTK